MTIIIETIEHKDQRYSTVGDWFFESHTPGNQVLRINVSKMADWRHEACIAVHELVEVLMCMEAGISQADVDRFDKEFEANRHPDSVEEPGDSLDAPYRKQHGIASGIERILGAELGVDWNKYADEVERFP